ncbi:DNA repair protein RadC [Candidatus Saccharibacteria bacterium]|nr:DNA repair protein RadC [Candidatus Saccharibacteria bacterium]
MKLQDKNPLDRPREKMKTKGAGALSDLELLMAIVGSGVGGHDVTEISHSVKKLLDRYGIDIPRAELNRVLGLGEAKIAEILAAFELAKRHLVLDDVPIIDSPEQAAMQLADIRDKKQEYFVCLTLDGANRLIAKRVVSIGTLTASLVHPREVFADAVTDRAASVIVAHNHPSGSLDPSPADKEVTKRLQKSGELLGISLTDHLIVTKTGYMSIV